MGPRILIGVEGGGNGMLSNVNWMRRRIAQTKRHRGERQTPGFIRSKAYYTKRGACILGTNAPLNYTQTQAPQKKKKPRGGPFGCGVPWDSPPGSGG